MHSVPDKFHKRERESVCVKEREAEDREPTQHQYSYARMCHAKQMCVQKTLANGIRSIHMRIYIFVYTHPHTRAHM